MALSFRRLCARTGCASNVECRRLKWRVAGDGWRRSGKRARESGTPPASLGAAGAPVGDRLKPHLRRARSGIPNRLTLACIQSRRPAGAPPAWSAGSGCSTCVQSAVARDQWPVWEGELCGDRLSPAPDGRTPGNSAVIPHWSVGCSGWPGGRCWHLRSLRFLLFKFPAFFAFFVSFVVKYPRPFASMSRGWFRPSRRDLKVFWGRQPTMNRGANIGRPAGTFWNGDRRGQ